MDGPESGSQPVPRQLPGGEGLGTDEWFLHARNFALGIRLSHFTDQRRWRSWRPRWTPVSLWRKIAGIVKRLVQHRCSRGDQGPVIGHTLGACKGGGKGVIT
ncbi:hypothetical protein MINS_22920 [Mycolicibacterium insubricum]|nr:hypothetical protein MINS_22920 [Mycolicibacterium insubricum]